MRLHTCTFNIWNTVSGYAQGKPAAASLIAKNERQITG